MRLIAFAESRVGAREQNEDSFAIVGDLGLFVVADGMGGYQGGEVASNLAVRTVDGKFHERTAADARPARDLMGEAFREANVEVRSARSDDLDHMGTTLSALAITGRQAVIGHIGDSRVYLLRWGELRRITCDHTMVESLKAVGVTNTSIYGIFSHVITRAIGIAEEPNTDLSCVEVEVGDRFLLCTDGLTDVLDDATIGRTMTALPPWESCEALVEEALRRGARDNVTALVVEVKPEPSDAARADDPT
jgi:PPM family protein phosphatase